MLNHRLKGNWSGVGGGGRMRLKVSPGQNLWEGAAPGVFTRKRVLKYFVFLTIPPDVSSFPFTPPPPHTPRLEFTPGLIFRWASRGGGRPERYQSIGLTICLSRWGCCLLVYGSTFLHNHLALQLTGSQQSEWDQVCQTSAVEVGFVLLLPMPAYFSFWQELDWAFAGTRLSFSRN